MNPEDNPQQLDHQDYCIQIKTAKTQLCAQYFQSAFYTLLLI